MLFDLSQNVHALPTVHKIDGQTCLAESASSPNSVKICLAIGLALEVNGKVKVHDDCHLLNVDSCNITHSTLKLTLTHEKLLPAFLSSMKRNISHGKVTFNFVTLLVTCQKNVTNYFFRYFFKICNEQSR